MHDNNKDQGSDTENAENGWQTPGILLRKARRERGLGEEEVCKELGLGLSALKALEADDFSRLPTAIYVRGYIRSYCALLGIDEQPVLDCYRKYCEEMDSAGTEETAEVTPVTRPLPVWKKPLFWGAVAVVVVIIVLLLVRGASPDADANQGLKKATAIQPGLAALQLQFDAMTWVEVIDARDDILLAELKKPGETAMLQGVPPFKVRLGDGKAVKIAYAGRPVEVKSTTELAVAEVTVGR